jgi:U4/U6 small nuclear ribonucleoprotein PRP31
MDANVPTIKEVVEASNQLIAEVSHHPAIVQDDMKKKNKEEAANMMEVNHGDELDQIELANKFVAEIDEQIKAIHKAVRSKYSYRFPELKVPDPMQYIITVQLLGNRPDRVSDDNVKEQLSEVLEPKMLLLVTMSASTTQGVKLEHEEMDKITRACAVAIHLANLRTKLLSFVEKNMTVIAPNLSVILGAPIAAKLMGLAGGLMNLAMMPSCNIPILGSHKLSNIELDFNAPPRVGLIYECDLIQQIPFDHTKDVRKRAVKWVANKLVLAARCDVSKSDPEGKAGRKLREEIESKINKELEPPPKKAPRPLPAPIEKTGKKRGGKRSRRMKERYAITELRKAANRINFGDVGDDAYQDDLGLGRSQLKSIQKLRGPQINEKTRIRLSKGAQKKLAKANQQQQQQQKNQQQNGANDGPKNSANNTEEKTCIILKPDEQGLQIFNPKARDVYAAGTSGESSKYDYFSNTAGFFAVKREDK